MSEKLLMVIDGSSLVHRAFYANPFMSNKSGLQTNAIYGFLNMLFKIKDEYNPSHICVAFDRKGPTFRHEEYSDYKGTRDKTPSELSQQFPYIKDALAYLGIKSVDLSKYEADDIAGTLAKEGEEKGYNVLLVTGDKDYFQL
ncbi:MAG: DNA polymerase I, partial [Clostridia bacterium]|nr:DNA polymerase I [Clostridia bacterium]